jgi:F0F1-type ATP synthase assembly protein I
MVNEEDQSGRLWRLSAMGFTFVSMIIAGGLLGWLLSWIFGQPEHERNFIVYGSIVGIVYGTIDFIRNALRAVRENEQ